MDNVSHSLLGLALSRAGLDRWSPRATALLVLSANAPDVDIAALAGGRLTYFEWHRGYSHSLIGLPLMAALTVVVVAALFRQRLPWWRAFLLCCVGVASHLLLDWTNTYGIRLALPLSSRWFHLDTTHLYDGVLLAVLGFAAVWPLFSGLVGSEIGERRRPGRGVARFALIFFFAYDAARGVLHGRAVEALQSRLYDDMAPVKVGAFPDPVNPFVWTGAVEGVRAQYLYPPANLEALGTNRPLVFYKPVVGPQIEAARTTEPFRFLQYFAQFPVWQVEGDRVELTDLRFGTPGAGAFHAIALVTPGGPLQSWWSYGAGTELGRVSK